MTALVPNNGPTFGAAVDGCLDAQHDLLQQHTAAIEAVCFRRLRSRVDAEDAVQETLLRGLRSLSLVEDPSRLKSYLCRIAERVCLDMLREGARAMPQEIEDSACTAVGPEEAVIADERDAMVRLTLSALTERQAEALWMRDALEQPVPVVAARLGVTEGSARVMLTRARAKMREGWAKVAAVLPLGVKLPTLATKAVTIGPLAVPIIPASLILITLALATPGAIRTLTAEAPTVSTVASPATTVQTRASVQMAPINVVNGTPDDSSAVPDASGVRASTSAQRPDQTVSPASEVTVGGVAISSGNPEDRDQASDDLGLQKDALGGVGIEFGEEGDNLAQELDEHGLDLDGMDPATLD